MNHPTVPRRAFLTSVSLTAAGLAAPATLAAASVAPSTRGDVPRYPQDAWFDKLPGKHRLLLDATNATEAGGAIGFGWNFLRTSQTGYNLKDADQAVIICLRHSATLFAIANEVYQKYPALASEKYTHPETERKVKGGNVFRPGSTNPKSIDDGFTLDGLAKRGVHFAICGVATRGMASMIAGKGATRDAVEKAMDELVAALPENAHVMSSGILAAQRAGEYGYTVIRG
ncbi:MAG: hypothetical protein P3B98_11865 [Gemmatimonadota bacterium]|nr:hypothetical protein [Gemmatimonadota bacterium]